MCDRVSSVLGHRVRFSCFHEMFGALNSPVLQTLVVTEDSEASLKAILKYSLFPTVSELEEQMDSIQGKKGTKIIIWNIRRSVAQRNQTKRIDCISKAALSK